MLTGIGIGVPFTRRRGFSAGDLFANSEVGVWYDPSDFSTMFQDSAGTTAAVVGQPVGLVLDKSQGLVLGSDVGFTFDSATGWTLGSGIAITGGNLVFTNVAQFALAEKALVLTSGVFYKFVIDVTSISAGATLQVADGATAIKNITAAGVYTLYFKGAGRPTIFVQALTAALSASLASISIQPVAGNHATQATSTARPVLRAGLDYDGVDDYHAQSAGGGSTTAFFLCAGIRLEGGAGTTRTLWSDGNIATFTGYIVRIGTANTLQLLAGNGSAYTTVATAGTLSVGTDYVITAWDDGTNLNVQINNGTVASVARPIVSGGTSTASIGVLNGSALNYFNGLIYSLIQVKNDAGTDAERTSTKAYVASKSGVTL